MKTAIRTTAEALSNFFKADRINWMHFDKALKSIEDINAFDEKNEETILTELIAYSRFCNNDSTLIGIIESFLRNGYDVEANEGCNGGLVLSKLCWIAYTENIIECVKLLLDAGAPIDYKSADAGDEFDGVQGSLKWNLSGAWYPDCAYIKANILEAYYAIIEAYRNNKDYHDIDSFHKCLGKTLTKVSYVGDVSNLEFGNEVGKFQGKVVLWFGAIPLVISNYMDMVINPIFTRENESCTFDITSAFDEILGAKLNEIRYLDTITNFLEFDNGYRLLFSSCGIGDRKRKGIFEIRPIENVDIENLKITEICREKCKVYSSETVDYLEQVLTLFCEDGVYCLFPGECYDGVYNIGMLKCSEGLVEDYARKFPLSNISKIHEFKKDGRVVGLRFECNEGYLYIKAHKYYDLEIMLSKNKFDIIEQPLLWEEVGIHMDFSLRTFKDKITTYIP